jgi:hypothetical protein
MVYAYRQEKEEMLKRGQSIYDLDPNPESRKTPNIHNPHVFLQKG